MIKYAKVINNETKECEVGLGTNTQFYISQGMTEQDVELAYTGNWYLAGYAPQKSHNDEIKDQIEALEKQITERNMRGAILGDQFALTKISEIEAQIADLRRRLEGGN